jgi:hypothetical protein
MYFQNFIGFCIYINSNDKINDLDIRNDLYSNVYLYKDTCLFGMCGYRYDYEYSKNNQFEETI